MMDRPNMSAAALFYLIYVVGIVLFAVGPALKNESLVYAIAYGALFGFFTYATYDLTNYATLKDWPVMVAVVDTAWGTALAGFSAGAGYLLSRQILG
jgi:uncharacterized membrane protein